MNEGDDKLLRRYRELPRDEPPPALDAAILAASRRAVASRPWSQRFAGPVSVAAVLVLAVGVTLNMQREQPGVEVAAPASEYSLPPSAAPESVPSEPARAPAAQDASAVDAFKRDDLARQSAPAPAAKNSAERMLQKEAKIAPAVVAPEARRSEPRPFAAPSVQERPAAVAENQAAAPQMKKEVAPQRTEVAPQPQAATPSAESTTSATQAPSPLAQSTPSATQAAPPPMRAAPATAAPAAPAPAAAPAAPALAATAPATTAPPPVAAAGRPAPPAPSAIQMLPSQSDAAHANSQPGSSTGGRAALAAPREKRELADIAAPSAKAKAAPALPDPAAELERIARLRTEGRHEEADKALDEFRRKHPGYRVPDAVWDRVRRR